MENLLAAEAALSQSGTTHALLGEEAVEERDAHAPSGAGDQRDTGQGGSPALSTGSGVENMGEGEVVLHDEWVRDAEAEVDEQFEKELAAVLPPQVQQLPLILLQGMDLVAHWSIPKGRTVMESLSLR